MASGQAPILNAREGTAAAFCRRPQAARMELIIQEEDDESTADILIHPACTKTRENAGLELRVLACASPEGPAAFAPPGPVDLNC